MAPRATESAVRIDGLDQLRRQLRQVEASLPKELAAMFQRVAEEVAVKVRGKVNSRTGRAVRSVKAARSQKGAIVRAGGRSVPYWGPLDFGGYPKARAFIPEGRLLYPTADEEGPRATEAVEQGLRDVVRRAGLD